MLDRVPRGQLPQNFRIEEFVHPEYVRMRGRENAIQHVTDFQIQYANALRVCAGVPIRLNDYVFGGDLVGRGTRPPWFRPKGGGLISMHYLGMALDADSEAMTIRQLFECVHDNFETFWEIGLTTIEDIHVTKTWLHGDGRILPAAQLIALEKSKKFNIVKP